MMQDENGNLVGLGPCKACGRNPALGWSQIGDDWYCHPDDGPSCYVTVSISEASAGVVWSTEP